MDRPYFSRPAIIALAVIISGLFFTEASRLADISASGASVLLKVLENSQSLESAQDKPSECKEKTAANQPTTTVTIAEKTLQAKFACGGNFTGGMVPDLAKHANTCCKNPACNTGEQVELSSVLGVDGKAESSDHTVTITLAKVPDAMRGETFYYKCKTASRALEDYCLVAVRLPGPLADNDCAIDRTVALSLSAPQTTAEFKCSGKLEKSPYVVKTGDVCTDELAENPILQLGEANSVGDTNTLGVAELPDATTKLCYKCVYEDVPKLSNTTQKEKRTCSVMVTVTGRGTPTPGGSETSTSTSSTSAASIAYKTPGVVASAVVALSALAVN